MTSHPSQLFHELKEVHKKIPVRERLKFNGITVAWRPCMKAVKVLLFSMTLTAVMMCGPMIRAQENAELAGRVTDPSGVVIPNAQLTIANTGTGESRSTTSNCAGLYGFSGLNHGIYPLKVEARGVKKTGVAVNVAATVPGRVVLEIGASSQAVTVEADALHLQAETNVVSNLISGDQIIRLAIHGWNMISLTTLGTGDSGMFPAYNGITVQGSAFTLSFNGIRPDHNDWLIDGGEAYDRGSGGKFALMPTMDAIAEFQRLSSNYGPDCGDMDGTRLSCSKLC
jgi:hypothetical protein